MHLYLLLVPCALGTTTRTSTRQSYPQIPYDYTTSPNKRAVSINPYLPDNDDRDVRTPAQAIKGLYAAFNARDADAAGDYLADACVYEDLLLGPATVCRGKRAFVAALRFHPAFVSSNLLDAFPFELPKLMLVVDSVAEGASTVGVEWHVEVGGAPFPLGRALTQAEVDTATGQIVRVVDIAEAPWRIVGILLLPFISVASFLFPALYQVPELDAKDDDEAAAYSAERSAALTDGRRSEP